MDHQCEGENAKVKSILAFDFLYRLKMEENARSLRRIMKYYGGKELYNNIIIGVAINEQKSIEKAGMSVENCSHS